MIALIVPISYSKVFLPPNVFDGLSSSTFFISACATVSTTTLMAYRIYVTSQLNASLKNKSLARFGHILHVLFESSSFYSMILLANALLVVIPFEGKLNLPRDEVAVYFTVIVPITTVRTVHNVVQVSKSNLQLSILM